MVLLAVGNAAACCVFPSVGGFTGLRRLTIEHPLDADMVSALIADNPHLSTLTIGGRSIFSIGEVLPSLPPDADRCLKELSLKELTFLRGDVPLLVPFIKEVKRLEFWFMLDIPDDLWVELTRCYAPLTFLRSLFIRSCKMCLTESFVDFISSCSILEELHFTSSDFDYEQYHGVATNTSLRTAHRFWIDALPRLASSLRDLELEGSETSGFYIQDVKYVDALSECHLLEVLNVAVKIDLASAVQTRTLIVNHSSPSVIRFC
ncbi:hypothetical protein BDZ89DRAFT_1081029 [Hymenopellis radicata]|nr:hypothetical protein BDZ89DRAFT_1081029 [Hymenopellis radicata]